MSPQPELTPENTDFWTGGAVGELRITFCTECALAIHPPQVVCPQCQSARIEARAVPGTGTVYTYTVNYQPRVPGMVTPFALAVVDIDGAPGVRITARVVGGDPEDVRIGQRMGVEFETAGDDIWIPVWRTV